MQQPVSIIFDATNKIAEFKIRWQPEAKELADCLHKVIDYLRLVHFTKEELICATQTPRQNDSTQTQEKETHLQSVDGSPENQGGKQIPRSHP